MLMIFHLNCCYFDYRVLWNIWLFNTTNRCQKSCKLCFGKFPTTLSFHSSPKQFFINRRPSLTWVQTLTWQQLAATRTLKACTWGSRDHYFISCFRKPLRLYIQSLRCFAWSSLKIWISKVIVAKWQQSMNSRLGSSTLWIIYFVTSPYAY